MIKNSIKKTKIFGLAALFLLMSCNKKEEMMNALADYNNSKQDQGYHFGDKIILPKSITEDAKMIVMSFGDKETSSLTIDPHFFSLGDNHISFIITTQSGETLTQDATINVFTKNPEKNIAYQVVAEYPHNPNNFVEGFQMEGDYIYESDGLTQNSQLIKYPLGSTNPIVTEKQADDIFSEGCAIVGDKIYQLTYQNRKGFIYDKSTLKKISEFDLPNAMIEGWGLTYDGKNLIATDGSKNLFFLDINNPSKVVKTIAVAGNKETFDKLNELEYHDGFIFSNVWYKPIILKINPANGEVLGKIDFTKLTSENDGGDSEHVLNGIAFKGENMLITGKNWSKIFEVSIK